MAARKKPKRRLNLALQGGGSHGAYTWGVLDRLLEEEDIEIVGISGTSAGAMNAAVMVSGLTEGGPAKAKEALAGFWRDVSCVNTIFMPFGEHTPDIWHQWQAMLKPHANMIDQIGRTFSPYELNPMNINPLRDILKRRVNIKQMHKHSDIKLFVTATDVRTGQPHVFKREDVSIDALLASACLPNIFQAVEIDGKAFWDGGYVGNPSLWPLIYHTDCEDMLLVDINPTFRDEVPKTGPDIVERINEISFNASLIAEMRAINFVKKLIKRGTLDHAHYKNIHMHMIGTSEWMRDLGASSKLKVDWAFFQELHSNGYDAANRWLRLNKSDIGKRSSVDIERVFLKGAPA